MRLRRGSGHQGRERAGHRQLRCTAARARAVETKVPGAETVMSLLQRHFKVTTRYGGGFVESIDGHTGGVESPRLVLLRQRHPGRQAVPPRPTSTPATTSGGTCTTGPRPIRSRRWSAPTRSRSPTASAASEFPTVLNCADRRAGGLQRCRHGAAPSRREGCPIRCWAPARARTRWRSWSAPGARSRA